MSKLAVDLAVFDLMGTVIVDPGVMEGALRGIVARYAIPHHDRDLLAMRGAGKRAAFAALLERTLGAGKGPEWSRAKAEEMYVAFKRLLVESYAKESLREVPGAGDTLRWLRGEGVKVAATSALDADLTEPILEHLGWAQGVFDCKVSTEEVPAGRPAPYMIFLAMMRTGVTDVRRVAAVGDTTIDLQAGTNAGAGWVIGVLSGAHDLATLGATAHTHILESVAALPALLLGR